MFFIILCIDIKEETLAQIKLTKHKRKKKNESIASFLVGLVVLLVHLSNCFV